MRDANLGRERAMAFGKGHHLHLIDGSAFIFRAYHALPPLARKSDGLPVGAVSGFVNLLQKRWPQASLHGLMREARHHLGRDGDVQVANTFFRLFPLKT